MRSVVKRFQSMSTISPKQLVRKIIYSAVSRKHAYYLSHIVTLPLRYSVTDAVRTSIQLTVVNNIPCTGCVIITAGNSSRIIFCTGNVVVITGNYFVTIFCYMCGTEVLTVTGIINVRV